ncbi:hypothetical protein [Prevotella intermedia]|uniref:hypothetical protein n=1 Tax=Prevotella intermedia TaxID=28131 RepID=UPI000C232E11|nr:hypothetical protein [Prevotella intermedia]PJI22417.1 hypothetical protein CTM45_03375 [Prevotella intermedia]
MKQIVSYDELKKIGKDVAFLSNNRNLSITNLKSICKTYQQFGTNISPIIYVTGEKAQNEGLNITDAITGEKVTNPENYIVVIDGQHRFIASRKTIKESKDGKELLRGTDTPTVDVTKLMFMECDVDAPISNILGAANYAAKTWQTNDYLAGASMDSTDEATKLAGDLVKRGFKANTISLIMYGKADKLKSADLKRAYEDKALNPNGLDLDRAKRFLDIVSKQFKDNTIKKRYLIQAALELGNDKLRNLTDEQIKEISKAKTKEEVISTINK